MDILPTLFNLDQQLFFWVNTRLHNSWLDTLFVILTTKENWLLPSIVLLGLFLYRRKKEALWVIVFLAIGVVLADQLSSGVLKPWIGRLRPCKTLEGFRLLVPCGGRWSFPSSHAANAAAVATFLWWYVPRWKVLWGILALLIGYSRIYVGVHYPLDVLAGWFVGVISGWVAIQLARWGEVHWKMLSRS